MKKVKLNEHQYKVYKKMLVESEKIDAEEKQSRVYDCLDKISDALVEYFETDTQWILDGNVVSFHCKDMGNGHKLVNKMKKYISNYLRVIDIYSDDKNGADTKINIQLPFTTKSLSTGETINLNILEKFEKNVNELVKGIFKNQHLKENMNEGVMNFFRHNVGNNKILRGLSYVLRFFLMTISSLAFEIDLIRWDYDQIVVEMVGPECMAIKQLATDNHLDKCLELSGDNKLIINFNTSLNPRYNARIINFTKDIKKHYNEAINH